MAGVEPDDRDPNEQAEREEKLLLMLKAEEEQSLSWAESETTSQQIEALQRYFGEPYGDEEEGRSQVCTREVFETILFYAALWTQGVRDLP